jgi:hypothetical protein
MMIRYGEYARRMSANESFPPSRSRSRRSI